MKYVAMRIDGRVCGLVVCVGAVWAGESAGQQAIPGYLTQKYGTGINMGHPSFAPDGVLYAGREDNGAQVKPWRFPIGGGNGTPFGDASFEDPDVVLFDAAGLIGGAGDLLVGGACDDVDPPDGCIDVILGDRSVANLVTSLGFTNPEVLKFSPSGTLLISDSKPGGEGVWEIDADLNVSLLAPVPQGGGGMAVHPDGRIFIGVHNQGVIRIHAADGALLDGAFVTGLGSGNLSLEFGPGGDAWGEDLYIVAQSGGKAYRISDAGVVTQIGSGFVSPRGMTFGPDEGLYVSQPALTGVFRFIPCTSAPLDGDVNQDGAVGSIDLNLLLGDFGCTSACAGDADGDGDTDSSDLNIVLGQFGQTCID